LLIRVVLTLLAATVLFVLLLDQAEVVLFRMPPIE
jgi:hypothetical protein